MLHSSYRTPLRWHLPVFCLFQQCCVTMDTLLTAQDMNSALFHSKFTQSESVKQKLLKHKHFYL